MVCKRSIISVKKEANNVLNHFVKESSGFSSNVLIFSNLKSLHHAQISVWKMATIQLYVFFGCSMGVPAFVKSKVITAQ